MTSLVCLDEAYPYLNMFYLWRLLREIRGFAIFCWQYLAQPLLRTYIPIWGIFYMRYSLVYTYLLQALTFNENKEQDSFDWS